MTPLVRARPERWLLRAVCCCVLLAGCEIIPWDPPGDRVLDVGNSLDSTVTIQLLDDGKPIDEFDVRPDRDLSLATPLNGCNPGELRVRDHTGTVIFTDSRGLCTGNLSIRADGTVEYRTRID